MGEEKKSATTPEAKIGLSLTFSDPDYEAQPIRPTSMERQ